MTGNQTLSVGEWGRKQLSDLESGHSKPSTRTLERYAEATGSKLPITLEAAE